MILSKGAANGGRGMIQLLFARILPLAVVACLLLAGLRRVSRPAFEALARRLDAPAWAAAGAVLTAVYVASLLCSLALPAAMDMVEATVIEVAALLRRGEPAYTALDAAHRYSLLYGPMCFLPFAAALRTFGGGIGMLKLLVAAFDLGGLLLLWFAFRRQVSRGGSLLAVGACAAALEMRNLSTFQVRGDAVLVFAVALAVFGWGCRRAWCAAALLAVALGLAVDVKFTAVFFLLVPLYLLGRRHGVRWAVRAIGGGLALAAVPFALPAISLRNYAGWLREAAHHPLSARLLVGNAVALAVFLVPVAGLCAAAVPGKFGAAIHAACRHRTLLLVLAVSLAGSAVTGSKVGAGRMHLNGSVLVLAQLAVLLWARLPADARGLPALRFAGAVYLLALLVPAAAQLAELRQIAPARRGYALGVLASLDRIRARYPGQTMEMGYDAWNGPTSPVDPLSLFGTQLVLAGRPLLVDAGAMHDMGLSGLGVPQATVDVLRHCEVAVWVLPQSAAPPFTLRNGYADDVPRRFADPLLFSAKFRAEFSERYVKTGSEGGFDVWQCWQQLPDSRQKA